MLSSDDFSHHKPGVARLNHGSFGSCPKPVLAEQQRLRELSLAQPDEFYFSGELHQQMKRATDSVIPMLGGNGICAEQVCLVENATVASVTIARRWARLIQPGDTVVVLSIAYRACIHILREYCEPAGAKIEILDIPFPAESAEQISAATERGLKQLAATGRAPKFAFLDHISSQPAMLLPIEQMVKHCRALGHAELEVAVDGAHSVGSTALDMDRIGADWFFSNLHKWGFAPSTATIMYAASAELMLDTGHPITSWHWQQGLHTEAQFTGTRDYSAMLAVPAAMNYLSQWRSDKNETTSVYCHRRVMESARYLCSAWQTPLSTPEELVASQYMVPLPDQLTVDDKPGQPGAGVRATLRQRYDVEAAIGNFGRQGNFVRLSYAVYNCPSDVERLAEAILQIAAQQSSSV